ncbi:AIG1 family protein putative [Entamoeba histolytica]|uniref:AIG1 family protein n=3 Tax=Entamoeba histolytica TaxID=5759 RepID=C4MB73_ENTH1|nr:AIG1 family protein, putative [Entamoeba histolytica HM-1:IMSS]EAL42870.1 AIG1 family protein, putative [Entamoeba histolytica HM-1:IMSS]BBD14082.1 AIG1 family protein [Entamoeba histolytica HM-1:IMSS]BBD14085.1 AIG1 family protein [Entamoeba histolytica KU50]GAT99174.1 AIG1 family protein putative [Entamoeba histolytica]|eukprot:XP_648256.1 AIG1 family protein, putative [Entamoeba histolytica HM-1:IMSS]
MSTEEVKETKLLLIGDIGDGKSSLGNFILKDNKFAVSSGCDAKTQETVGYNGEGNRRNVFVIDTPGFNDLSEMNEKQQNQTFDYIKKQNGIDVIVIVLNYSKEAESSDKKDVLSENLKRKVKLLCNILQVEDFWKHICIIWTKCTYHISKNEFVAQLKVKKNKVDLELRSLIEETTGENDDIEFPMYYVDSNPDEGCDNSRSEKEIENFLTWAYDLNTFEKKGNEKVRPNYKKFEPQEKEQTEVIEVNDDFVKLRIYHIKREKRTAFDGEVTYTEWKVIDYNDKIQYKEKPKQESKESDSCVLF